MLQAIKEEIEIIKELHQEKEFRKRMIFPYISLAMAIIVLVLAFTKP